MNSKRSSHLDEKGRARMVDIGAKRDTERRAVASVRVLVSGDLLAQLRDNTTPKGDAIAAARIAGIQAAKCTSALIPLCHPLPLTFVGIEFEFVEDPPAVAIRAEARTCYKTGVEMEALTAAAVAALTIYDMSKTIERGIVIDRLRLETKTGGASGSWHRE